MIKAKKKIFLIEQFVYPEGWSGAEYPRKISVHLAKNGYEVNVICSKKATINNNISHLDNPTNMGVRLIHLDVPFKNTNNFKKLINQLYFCCFAFFKLILEKNIDLIISFSNPPQMILLNTLIHLIKKKPYLVISMDLYPDVLINHIQDKLIKNYVKKILNIFYDLAYKKAIHIICLGENMKDKIIKKGVSKNNITIINNWATGNFKKSKNIISRAQWDIVAKKVIIYSGNLGLTHDYLTILESIKVSNLKKEDLQLIFMAQGKKLNEAKVYVKNNNLENIVLFKKLVDNKDFPNVLAISDIALVTIRKGFGGMVYPSKFQGYISRSLPVIYIGPDCEISKIIRNENLGISFKNNKIKKISKFLKEYITYSDKQDKWRENALSFYSENMSEKKILKKYLNKINELT